MRPKDVGANATAGTESAEDAARGDASASSTVAAEAEDKQKPPIFNHLTPVSSTLATSGPKRGTYTNKYTCAVALANGLLCGASVTCYGNGKSETTSNA